jgi:hypothetical protein
MLYFIKHHIISHSSYILLIHHYIHLFRSSFFWIKKKIFSFVFERGEFCSGRARSSLLSIPKTPHLYTFPNTYAIYIITKSESWLVSCSVLLILKILNKYIKEEREAGVLGMQTWSSLTGVYGETSPSFKIP